MGSVWERFKAAKERPSKDKLRGLATRLGHEIAWRGHGGGE
jgi:hypothetical protein